jgi:hypothetical protein
MNGHLEDKVRRAADGALLILVARWAMVITLPVGGFLGAAVWIKLDKTAEATARLEERVSAMIVRQADLVTGFNSRFDAQAERIGRHDLRLDRLEDWRNSRSIP